VPLSRCGHQCRRVALTPSTHNAHNSGNTATPADAPAFDARPATRVPAIFTRRPPGLAAVFRPRAAHAVKLWNSSGRRARQRANERRAAANSYTTDVEPCINRTSPSS
jgi:hypothetical protein